MAILASNGVPVKIRSAILALAFGFAQSIAAVPPSSPYGGQEARDIKALSRDEVASLLDGKGGGLAKAAELNGYPGPAHVLEMADELHLTAEQRKRSEALFTSMHAHAISTGRRLVEAERTLDRLFADKNATRELVSSALVRIGQLQAEVRAAHLDAHLEQSRILSPEQSEKYAEMRGYESAGILIEHGGHHGH